jgi:deazaflavin-dependent oxidoreductase (nitroreductase family)
VRRYGRRDLSYDYREANLLGRFIRRTAGLKPVALFYARTLHHLDKLVFRLTRGRHFFASIITGLPVIMLRTTGARSGQPRTNPLLGIPEGDSIIVIASNYGQHRNPSWAYNLRAHPHAHVALVGEARDVVARELTGEERTRCYEMGIEIYPGWVNYRERASHREIPVFRLEPRSARDVPRDSEAG